MSLKWQSMLSDLDLDEGIKCHISNVVLHIVRYRRLTSFTMSLICCTLFGVRWSSIRCLLISLDIVFHECWVGLRLHNQSLIPWITTQLMSGLWAVIGGSCVVTSWCWGFGSLIGSLEDGQWSSSAHWSMCRLVYDDFQATTCLLVCIQYAVMITLPASAPPMLKLPVVGPWWGLSLLQLIYSCFDWC